MPLENKRVILCRVTSLYKYIHNLALMISRFNWFLGTLFLMAAFGALMNPPPYVAIAILFFLMGVVLLPPTDKLTRRYFNWQISGGIKGTIILVSFIVICLIVPQVETNTAKLFTRPIDLLKFDLAST